MEHDVKRVILLLLSLLIGACATAPSPQEAGQLFSDRLFRPPSAHIDAADVFSLNQAMRDYLAIDVARLARSRGRQRALFDALYERSQLKLEYDAAMTRNASEAFDARAGNCLSLV